MANFEDNTSGEAGGAKHPPKLVTGKSYTKWVKEVKACTLYTEIAEERRAPMICTLSFLLGSEIRQECMGWLERNETLAQETYSAGV